MALHCIFCKNKADSLEHVWPKWVLDSIKPYSDQLLRTVGTSTPKVIGVVGKTDVTVKSVCGTCNKGWMSDLETESRPVLGPLMHDLSIHFNDLQRHSISKWAAKTAMVMGTTGEGKKPMFYQKAECEALRLTGTVPPGTMVWLGRYVRSDLGIFSGQLWLDVGDAKKVAHAAVTTIIAGHLAAQILTVHVRPEYRDVAINFTPRVGPWDWHRLLCSVWPLNGSCTWPPVLSFNARGLGGIGALVQRWKFKQAAENLLMVQ